MMRWLFKNEALLMLVILLVPFSVTLGLYVRGVLKYRDIESWPSVEARIIRSGGTKTSVLFNTRTGTRTQIIDSTFVEFEYSVDGEFFRSNRATPDGGDLLPKPWSEPWRAYYKPSSPEVAVLNPVPYQGNGLLFASVFLGILWVTHLCVALPDIIHHRQVQSQARHRLRK